MPTRIIEYGGQFDRAFTNLVPIDQFVTAQSAMTAIGTSAPSAAFNDNTTFICVQSDEAISVDAGAAPVATANSYRLQAGAEQFFKVARGAGWKVAIKT